MTVELAIRHAVKFINDDQLPPDQDWALLECDGDTFVFIKRSRVTECVLEDAWSAYRQRANVTPLEARLRAS